MAIGRMAPGQDVATTAPVRSVAQAATGGIGRMSGTSVTTPGVGRMAEAPEPALNPSVGGFFKNLVGGFGDLVKGLGTLLVKAPIHDVAQLGAAYLVPGTQAIEEEPSMLATVARTALPGQLFPGADLGGKYGAIASDYAHRYGGASNIVRGLYEDPMSFILDALMFADGIGMVGKAGRVGAIAKYAPRLVSDAAAKRILGPALIETSEAGAALSTFAMPSRYGAEAFGSFTRAGGAYEDVLKLSKNPLVRPVQRQIYKGLSLAPDEAKLIASETPRAAEVLEAATRFPEGTRIVTPGGVGAEVSQRILKPKVGEFLAKHEQSKILSALRVRTQDKGAAAINELNRTVENIEEGAPMEARATLRNEATEIDTGIRQPKVLPRTDAIDIPETEAIVTALQDMPQIGKATDDVAAAATFAEKYATKPGGRAAKKLGAGGQRDEGIAAGLSPIAEPGGGEAGSLSFKLQVEAMEDSPRIGPQALRDMGYTDDMRVLDTISDAGHPWEGKHYVAKNPKTGVYAHVSVGTKELLDAQDAGAVFLEDILNTERKIQKVADDAKRLPEGDPRAINAAAEILQLKRRARAAREALQDDVFKDFRASHWERQGHVYDDATKMSLRTRPLRIRELVKRWMKEQDGDPEKYMERKFAIVRQSRLMRFLSDTRPAIARALDNYKKAPTALIKKGLEGKTYLDMYNALKMKGVPDNLIESILGKEPWTKSADQIISKMESVLWDYTIKEGSGGMMFDAAPFDWITMSDEFRANNLVTPGYTPYLPSKTPSQMARKYVPDPVEGATKHLFAKDLNALLFREGKIEWDLPGAIARANRTVITHDEVKGVFATADKQFGRNATLKEMEAANAGDSRFTGEVYYNPREVASKLDLRGELLSRTVLGIPEAQDVGEAIIRAYQDWAAKAFTESINNINGPLRSMPRHVAEQLGKEIRNTLGSEMKLWWDTPAKVWKASVLSLSPRWVLNNLFGNAIFVGIENPAAFKSVINQFDRKQRALARYMLGDDPIREVESGFFHATADDVRAASLRNDFTQGQAYGPVTEAAREIIMGEKESSIMAARMNAPSRMIQNWSKGVRDFNSYVEEAFRRGILLDELKRGSLKNFGKDLESTTKMFQRFADEGFPTDAEMGQALARVDRVIGNFTRYGPVEQGIIRRFFMPFYGFYRHMTNVLLKMPFEHPLKASLFSQVADMDEIMEAGTPSYLKGQDAIHIGLFGGDAWTRLKGMNPLAPFNEEYGAIGLLDPRIKLFVERSLGISTFTGEPWDLEDLGMEDEMVQSQNGEYWKVVRDGEGNVLDVIPSGRPNPDLLKHVISQFGMTSLIPQFQMYPRSFEQNLASWVGTPVTRPVRGTADALQYDAEMKAEALARASGGAAAEGFGSFGSFGEGFGSF